MKEFRTDREAKEFLVGRIVVEAKDEGIPLSEVERKMLYFSETDWTLPDIMQVNDEFEQNYDTGEYEAKIAGLIRGFWRGSQAENGEELDAWAKAEAKLREGDHYLLVMMNAAPLSESRHSQWLPTLSHSSSSREPGDRLRLWLTALACVVGMLVFAWLKVTFWAN